MEQLKITRDLIGKFAKQMREDEKSEATISKYLYDLRCFLDFAADKEIDKQLIMDYKAKLKEKLTLTSANSMLAALNSFLRFVERADLCVKQFKVQKKAFCSEDKELTKAEYLSLVRTAEKKKNERLSLVIQTICGTGIRVSELEFITVVNCSIGLGCVSCA